MKIEWYHSVFMIHHSNWLGLTYDKLFVLILDNCFHDSKTQNFRCGWWKMKTRFWCFRKLKTEISCIFVIFDEYGTHGQTLKTTHVLKHPFLLYFFSPPYWYFFSPSPLLSFLSFFSSKAGFFQLLLFFLSLFFFFGFFFMVGFFHLLLFFLFSIFSSSLWFLFSATYYSSSFFLFLHAMMAKGFNFSGLRCAFWAWSCGFCGVIFLVFLFVFIFIIYMQKNLLWCWRCWWMGLIFGDLYGGGCKTMVMGWVFANCNWGYVGC